MKLWGGRFEKATNPAVDDFHSSIRFDQALYKQDIAGSIAHARMLGNQGIIADGDARAIIAGLQGILADIAAGRVQFDTAAEDIHMNVEALLTQRIGDAGKRLHTGRSRNDQVALDCRMYVKDACGRAIGLLCALLDTLLCTAQAHTHTVMPGFTHLQKAQPVTLAFHMMAYAEMFSRDITRFADCLARSDVMPLGSGALAGTTYPLDRAAVADELGFTAITQNAMDGVSDRDFVLEFLFCASTVMMHLSRFCEEIILWASDEYKFVVLDDAFSTGSSIMPQKKNPDVAELIRGKTGRVYGDLMALLTVMKGLPLAYNKDMQEDKEALFDACNTLFACVDVFTQMLSTCAFQPQRMADSAAGGFTNATDAADYLVGRGIPFRQAHEIIGSMVLYCIKQRKALGDLTLAEFQNFHPDIDEDIYAALDAIACVRRRNLPGGPAPDTVMAHITSVREFLGRYHSFCQ
ncbi:MAG: argininosuccinate lyase [Eubacteriales bacterium]|nr:argininosuccinate lyase [Eubacteriales bacterium]